METNVNSSVEPQQPASVFPRRSVTDAVLDRLGRPESLFRVDAKRTWGDKYRVNVYCTEPNPGHLRRIRLTDSFFVSYSDEGLVSSPELARKYE